MSVEDIHRSPMAAIGCAVLTISDTRTADTDTSGRLVAALLEAAGHTLFDRRIVPDEPTIVTPIVRQWANRPEVSIVITTGGTGIARRDSTYEALHRCFDKEITGFGELFRMLSFADIGAAAMLSRATAGTIGRCGVFLLPGSEHAVRLAMTKLVLPELGHVVRELGR